MQSPEELAREKIDKLLTECGWIIQNRSAINLSAGRGIAIREALLKNRDEADYLLFVGGKAIGTVEAKPEGYTLTGVEEQSGKYGKGLLDIYPKWWSHCLSPTNQPEQKRDSQTDSIQLRQAGTSSPCTNQRRCSNTSNPTPTSTLASLIFRPPIKCPRVICGPPRSKPSATSRNPSPPTNAAPSFR
ncbi:MAG: hypothetical protein DME53_02985, partial [Verrucomicrobia bacterium]